MTAVRYEVRPGVYCDSIVLMQLQAALADLPAVSDAGAVMGTPENLSVLEANNLRPESLPAVRPDDLILVVRADTAEAAQDALGQVDALLARAGGEIDDEYRPRSLVSAIRVLPGAGWVLVSVPGRYAGAVAREALGLGRHVFLYSDNVALHEEVALKREAASRGLLVMGPDCGTAIVNGVGFGFANHVRRGSVGLVAASGTGLQAVSSHVHALGAGISHAIGTGGRDLHAEVGGITARQGLDLLARDPETRVIVLVSKPPEPEVVGPLLQAAEETEKPVVVSLLAYPPPAGRLGSLHFAAGTGEAATMAVELLDSAAAGEPRSHREPPAPEGRERYVRGLFSGGTLALEVLQALRSFLSPLHSNVSMTDVRPLPDVSHSRGHTILDLGADELTVGRPHPMIDNDLRLRRLRQEARDADVGLILLDVVLGYGAHPDPAGELAPAIAAAREERPVDVIVILVGTEDDPQDLPGQVERLARAGAEVFRSPAEAVQRVLERCRPSAPRGQPPVALSSLQKRPAAINVGLESLYDSLLAQGADAVHVDWRPPAGGNEELIAILEKLRR